MANNSYQVLLGFEDELINDKNKHLVNFKTNKIGGTPDIPSNIKLESPICNLCQNPQLFIAQIYAPLDNSNYHRTLYLYACINSNCWNQNESWTCLRIQNQETLLEGNDQFVSVSKSVSKWCNDEDDWGDTSNNDQENGNNIINSERISDEDEESFSLDDSLKYSFGNLTVDDKNANLGAQGEAVGRLHSPSASAEIEGEEGEIISIDSPTRPQNDITKLLHEVVPLPSAMCIPKCSSIPYFLPFFLNVWEESSSSYKTNDKHVRELLQEYQQHEDVTMSLDSNCDKRISSEVKESYEKSVPAHGDKMFHYFLSKIQKNPGQILRYSRNNEPLLLYPQMDNVKKCEYCHEERIFEFQILSTVIPKLKLNIDSNAITRLEFGTVLIYTCRNSCWSTDGKIRQETVIIQKEMY